VRRALFVAAALLALVLAVERHASGGSIAVGVLRLLAHLAS
jgi:hypothetical protein